MHCLESEPFPSFFLYLFIGYLARKTGSELKSRLRKRKFKGQCKLLKIVHEKYPALANEMVYRIKSYLANIDEQLKKHVELRSSGNAVRE